MSHVQSTRRSVTPALLLLAIVSSAAPRPSALAQQAAFTRGDANTDDALDVSDPVTTLLHLFLGSVRPGCMDAADANDDGLVNLSDPIFALEFLFQSGATPPPPYSACGTDPTADTLGCAAYDVPGCGFQPPVLEPIGDRSVTVGGRLEIRLAATHPFGDAVTFAAAPLPLPENSSLDAAGGLFALSPAAAQVGDLVLTFIATTGALSDSETVTITVVGAPPDGVTALSGRILDTNDFTGGIETPVVGATVSLLGTGISAASDAGGRFRLEPVPGGTQILDIDASTADPAPDGSPYSGFRERIELTEGITNDVRRPFFLPRIAVASLTTVDPAATTEVVNAALGVVMTVPPGAARGPDGADFTGELSISEVPDALAPAALPESLQPGLLITIQPVGVTFDPPVPVTFPNIDGLAPRSEVDIWSLDPETGTFVVVGRGRVSLDGASITTISGGIRAADWHFFLPPAASGRASDCQCRDRCCDDVEVGSTATLLSGDLDVEHVLPAWRSLETDRALRLVYRSDHADPRPIFEVEVTILSGASPPSRISAEIAVAGILQPAAVYMDTSGLGPGRLASDEIFRMALQFDASGFESGIYPYELTVTSHYPRSARSATIFGTVSIHNERRSPFGAGWSVDGVDRLFPEPGGSALLLGGDGSTWPFTVAGAPAIEILEPGWTVTRVEELGSPRAAHYSPRDGSLYAAATTILTGGSTYIWRLGSDGSRTRLASAGPVAGLAVDPVEGHVFFTSAARGLSRIALGNSESESWRAGLDASSLRGIAVAPDDYEGDVLAAGEGLFAWARTIFRFSVDTPGSQVEILSNSRPFDRPTDIAIGRREVFYVESGERHEGEPGAIFRLGADGLRTEIATAEPIERPVGIVEDPLTGDLLVLDAEADRVVRVNPATRVVSEMITGLVLEHERISLFPYGGIDMTPDGSRLFVSDPAGKAIYTLTRRAVLRSPAGDFSILVRNDDDSLTRTLRDGTRIEFDARGLQTAVVDRNGNTTTYDYDENGRLVSIRDPVGLETTLAYAAGFLARVTDPAGRTTRFEHDSAGDLVRIVDPDGTSRAFAYGPRHLMTAQVSKRGFRTEYEYRFGALARSTLPDGSTRELQPSALFGLVDPASGLGSEDDPVPAVRPEEVVARYADGNGTTFTYRIGPLGRQVERVDPDGGAVLTRDADGNITRRMEPDGSCVESTFDLSGGVIAEERMDAEQCALDPSQRDPAKVKRMTWSYELEFGRKLEETDETGRRTLYEIDPETGNRLSETRVAGEGGEDAVRAFTYTPEGLLETRTDAIGRVIAHDYDERGRLVATTTARGTPDEVVESYEYDDAGNVTAQIDRHGNRTEFEYDIMNRRVGMRDALGGRTTYEHDAEGNLVAVTDPRGNTTRHEYDSLDRQATTIDALGGETVFSYDGNGNQVSRTEPDGATTRFAHDSLGRPVSITNALGDEMTYEYNSRGLLAGITDPLMRTTSYEYDPDGRLVRTIHPDGTTEEIERDASGLITARIDELGRREEFEYDALRRRTRMTDPLGQETLYEYDLEDQLVSETDVRDQVWQHTYHAHGAHRQSTDPAGETEADAEVAGESAVVVQDIGGPAMRIERDALDRVSVQELSNGARRLFEYDAGGNLAAEVDPLGNRTEFLFDALDREIGEARADGSSSSITRDATGNPLSFRDVMGNVSEVSRDILGRLITSTDALGKSVSIEYDAAGNPIRVTDRSGRAIEYEYDARDRLVRETWDSGYEMRFTYDPAGNLIHASGPDFELAFSHDDLDRLTTTDNDGTLDAPRVIITRVHGAATLDALTDSLGGRIEWDYDEAGRVVEVRQSGTAVEKRVTFAYRGGRDLSLIDRGPGLPDTVYSYNDIGQLTEIVHEGIARTTYEYDLRGNVARITDADGVHAYAYDVLHRLIAAEHESEALPDERYQLDAAGNRISSHLHGDAYRTGSANRLLGDGAREYEYDDDGNLVLTREVSTGEELELSYDHRNRLVRARRLAGGEVADERRWAYDPFDRLIREEADGELRHYFYHGSRPILVTDAEGAVLERYLPGPGTDLWLAEEVDGEVLWQLSDHRSSVRDAVDGSGALTKHIAFDSYGRVVSESGVGRRPRFGFLGELYDPFLGCYRAFGSLYDPESGRLLQTRRARARPDNASIPLWSSPLGDRALPRGVLPGPALLAAGERVGPFGETCYAKNPDTGEVLREPETGKPVKAYGCVRCNIRRNRLEKTLQISDCRYGCVDLHEDIHVAQACDAGCCKRAREQYHAEKCDEACKKTIIENWERWSSLTGDKMECQAYFAGWMCAVVEHARRCPDECRHRDPEDRKCCDLLKEYRESEKDNGLSHCRRSFLGGTVPCRDFTHPDGDFEYEFGFDEPMTLTPR